MNDTVRVEVLCVGTELLSGKINTHTSWLALTLQKIGLSIALLVLSVMFVIWLCARIYRVGVLMYGKKPTLPEIVKWIRYA